MVRQSRYGVFDPRGYNFFFSDGDDVRRPGFAVRKGIEVVADPTVASMSMTKASSRKSMTATRLRWTNEKAEKLHQLIPTLRQ